LILGSGDAITDAVVFAYLLLVYIAAYIVQFGLVLLYYTGI